MNYFGRIYSIWDRELRMFVYVGQTRRKADLKPHGRAMGPIWKTFPLRFVYGIEREWDCVAQTSLNREESRFILRRNTFHNDNPLAFNFTTGGNSSGRLSEARKNDPELRRKRSENARRQHADPALKAKHRAAVTIAMANPTIKQKQQDALRPIRASTDFRAKISASLMANPGAGRASGGRLSAYLESLQTNPTALAEFKRRQAEGRNTPRARALRTELNRSILRRDEVLAKLRAATSRQWTAKLPQPL